MKGFIYIYRKKDSRHESDSLVKIINHLKKVEHKFNIKENKNIKSIIYTNEAEINESSINSKHISCIGQYVENKQGIKKQVSNLDNDDLLNFVSTLKGAFALAIADYNKNSMKFFTHIFRIDNIFYRETEDEIIVGTDPLIVSAVSNENLKPEIDISNSVSFLMNGYFADENTLFKEVQLVPPNSVMNIDTEGISIQYIDDSLDEIFTIKPNKEINNTIKENYIDAFKAVPKSSRINIGVTGGKDSRLALLGLLEAGYDVKTNTRGFLDNPDVIVAEKLTKKLNLPHKIIEPKILDSKGMNINLEKKSLEAMIATSGQVYGYENIKYQPDYKGNIGVTGVAALTMKGGYSNLNNLSPVDPYKEMLRRFLPLEDLLIKGKSEQYKQTLKNLVTSDFQNAQYKHALFYRNGRWTSGTRLAKSYSSDMYSPYYDNVFTKSIIKIQKKYLDNGFTQYTLMNKLNSSISLLPLVGSRWGFEKDKPVKAENYSGWLNRAPMYPTTKLANYNWRNLTLPDNTIIREGFKDILLCDPEHPVYEVVDYNKLKKLLDDKLSNKHLKFMWSLLSIYAYVNYLNGEDIQSKDLNIKIPETIVNEIRLTPKTTDLTHDIFSTNSSIKPIELGNKVLIKNDLNKNNNKNKYLVTFSNSVSVAVNNEKSLINGYKEITFNMHISSENKLALKYCIIFFNDKDEKIETQWFSKIINKQVKNIEGHAKIPNSTNTYKLAIKLPSDFNGELNIDYLFSTMK